MEEYLLTTRYSTPEALIYLNSSFPEQISEYSQHSIDDKLNFWEKTLLHTCKKKLLSDSQLTFNSKHLHLRFTRDGQFPLCMNDVLNNLLENTKILRIDHFKSRTFVDFALNSISWFASSDQNFTNVDKSFIFTEILKVFLDLM
jgi:hypothetical protein